MRTDELALFVGIELRGLEASTPGMRDRADDAYQRHVQRVAGEL